MSEPEYILKSDSIFHVDKKTQKIWQESYKNYPWKLWIPSGRVFENEDPKQLEAKTNE